MMAATRWDDMARPGHETRPTGVRVMVRLHHADYRKPVVAREAGSPSPPGERTGYGMCPLRSRGCAAR